MKFLLQLCYILIFTFIGELLHYFIPLPIPSSIYGFILLFLALEFKLIKITHLQPTSKFLIEIMPLMFVPAGVGIITSFNLLKPILLQTFLIIFISTILVMIISGHVTQFIIKLINLKKKNNK